MRNRYIAVDFFAGAGGLSQGLKEAGFEVAVANERNADAAKTYSYNHPETELLIKDIKSVTPKEIIDLAGKRPLLVAGGPPCQGFSTAGRRNLKDPRNSLFKVYLDKAIQIEPHFILIENVVGLLSFNQGKTLKAIKRKLQNAGYFVSMKVLNAADFGVPQTRRRLFILGSLDPNIDIKSMEPNTVKHVSCNEAISDLDFLGSGENCSEYKKYPSGEYQHEMRNEMQKLCNHEAPRHSPNTVKRFSMLKPGQDADVLPAHLKTNKRNQFRLDGSKPARTITTIPDDYVHPNLDRTLTVRECARLQSFPDSYIFLGRKTTGGKRRKIDCPQYTQVGNAIPPLLAKAVGSWLMSFLAPREPPKALYIRNATPC